ncbi:MAG: hypothetical protein R2739_00185 [Chitinophagales bacterium]|nr:hypothetical protein [Bacteroidota bacterium]
MQRYGELKHLLQSFNELIFGCGFYYYWNYEHKRSMRENSSTKPKGETLFIESMFDPCYDHQIELYFKNCIEHNLPKDYHIPDHWNKMPIEISSIQFATDEENEDDNLIQLATFKLHFHTFSEPDFYYIRAGGFYFEKVDEK